MAKLVYVINTSLDGYVADRDGKIDWAVPDVQFFLLINEIERPIGTYLYGRRMYETMAIWETAHTLPSQAPFNPGLGEQEQEFARIWRGAEKVVFSKSLKTVSSAKTRIERAFDPEGIRQMKSRAVSDITVGGSELAGQMIKAGLVDEYHLFMHPIIVGGGKHWLPGNVRLQLELINEGRIGNGMVYVHYRKRIN